ncbi:hypothetical protein [Celeribacter sp.]|uniref:hypothetical protein n=1 Tax=Celeribacter sp. TaxID=1890673 RepID=UPI003A8DBCF8
MDLHVTSVAEDKQALRARDFWSALVLIALSLFFLAKTLELPLGTQTGGGVSSAGWYTSAAIVPLGIFGSMLCLSIILLVISIRSGGAAHALSAAGVDWQGSEVLRFLAVAVMLLAYIVGLVPRVDFILVSGLLITALISGFHGRETPRPLVPVLVISVAALFAFLVYGPQSRWSAWGDDIVALCALVVLTVWHQMTGVKGTARKVTPLLAIGVPLVLVCAMAFGFRQNVPNRGGLIFSKIEYSYYVHLRPLWRP